MVHFRFGRIRLPDTCEQPSEKFYGQGLETWCKVVHLLAQKLSNDMTLDWYPLMSSSLHTRQS